MFAIEDGLPMAAQKGSFYSHIRACIDTGRGQRQSRERTSAVPASPNQLVVPN